jgi:hypothetical protein
MMLDTAVRMACCNCAWLLWVQQRTAMLLAPRPTNVTTSPITYCLPGPLQVLFGSTPTYPDAGRCWRIIEKYQVRRRWWLAQQPLALLGCLAACANQLQWCWARLPAVHSALCCASHPSACATTARSP